MKQFLVLNVSICGILLSGCCSQCEKADDREFNSPIERLLYKDGTRYDVANYLLENPDYSDDHDMESSHDFRYHSIQSQDGKLRIYSIFEGCDEYGAYYFSNIAHYENADSLMSVKCDLDFNKRIHKIGIKKTPSKTYYLFVSQDSAFHKGDSFVYYSINVYSIDKDGLMLKPDFVFKTKDGRILHSIDVEWNDIGWRYSDMDGQWGITMDSETSTNKIYIQLVDEFGRAQNEAMVYQWDGRHFTYERRESAYFKD